MNTSQKLDDSKHSEATPLTSDLTIPKLIDRIQKVISIIQSFKNDPRKDAIISIFNRFLDDIEQNNFDELKSKYTKKLSIAAQSALKEIVNGIIEIYFTENNPNAANNDSSNNNTAGDTLNNNQSNIIIDIEKDNNDIANENDDGIDDTMESQIIGYIISKLMKKIFDNMSYELGWKTQLIIIFKNKLKTPVNDLKQLKKNCTFWKEFLDKFKDKINIEMLFNILNDKNYRQEKSKVLISCLKEHISSQDTKSEITNKIVQLLYYLLFF